MNIPRAVSTSLSPPALRSHLARSNTPLILKGLTKAWKVDTWGEGDPKPTLSALRNLVGEDTAVEIEVGAKGRGYLDPGWQRITMGFGLFLDAFVLGNIPSSDPQSLPVGYLAQADLLDTCSPLTKALPELSHYRTGSGDIYRRTLWVGPERSFTPFHTDPNIGIYTQIVGGKTFHLLPPQARDLLSPSERPLHKNTSTIPVSVESILNGEAGLPPAMVDDLRERLRAAFTLPGGCVADLGPGDSVLIPRGWWHSAEGKSIGVGVNAWFR